VKQYDVIVIGGGHAGVEAAAISARAGSATLLITMDPAKIGVMSCNPAIGGLGKGHLVREIDALDGIMGVAADRAGIQYRLLNRSRGAAVQGPRVQSDRKLYRNAVQQFLAQQANLSVLGSEVSAILTNGHELQGVLLADGSEVRAKAVVLTAGTFLNGIIHLGSEKKSGGRVGDKASEMLADQLRGLGLQVGRLKTGTPPRLDGRTIDWHVLERQDGDENPEMMSFLSERPFVAQLACGITHTNPITHDIIRGSLHLSAMYGGHIQGVGPRYCPSIEDKIVRFADKDSHQVFLEPEGLDDHTVYPNGISTSLPADIQLDYVRSMEGLHQAEILQPGYAIEYDFFDPRGLTHALMVEALPGLFMAGQINGTTGYEEAAAQGIVAGLNASRHVQGRNAYKFAREQSYIGVMVDDLVQRGVTEPYRMFTSRAEHRLALRADNADQRLTPAGQELGVVGRARLDAFDRKFGQIVSARTKLTAKTYSPQQLAACGISVKNDGRCRSLLDLLAQPTIDRNLVLAMDAETLTIEAKLLELVVSEALYAPYSARAKDQIEKLKEGAATIIPDDFVYGELPGLTTELRHKLTRLKPATLAEAAQIEGVTPAALALLHIKISQAERSRKRA
jgi:tRNA uridine 5-carboxymethylaminomethyl modification enzyme